MYLRRLKDDTKKTSLLRCLWGLWDIPANICWSWRRLWQVFSITILHLPSRLEDVLEDEKCYAEDVLKTCLEDVLKTCLEDLLKILRRQTKYLLGISVYLSWDLTNLNVHLTSLYFTNLYLTTLKRIQNTLITGDWFGVMKLA